MNQFVENQRDTTLVPRNNTHMCLSCPSYGFNMHIPPPPFFISCANVLMCLYAILNARCGPLFHSETAIKGTLRVRESERAIERHTQPRFKLAKELQNAEIVIFRRFGIESDHADTSYSRPWIAKSDSDLANNCNIGDVASIRARLGLRSLRRHHVQTSPETKMRVSPKITSGMPCFNIVGFLRNLPIHPNRTAFL